MTNSLPSGDKTHAVLLTPTGRGAVATVLIAGADVNEAAAPYLKLVSGVPLAKLPVRQIALGSWQSKDATSAEELVVCRDGADSLAVHCHGGRAAAERILADLEIAGACRTTWQKWVQEKQPDSIVAAAHIALASATTERAAATLLDQYRGACSRAIREIISLIEMSDFDQATTELQCLRQRGRLGIHLTKPWRIVLAGVPNVGKSSLINAIVGYDRAIVHSTPGTTRDVLSANVAIQGWPVELLDTAGLRDSGDLVERSGIDRAKQQLAFADLVLWVTDCRSQTQMPAELLDGSPAIIKAENKADLLEPEQPTNRTAGAICLSAKTGQGIDRLMELIADRLVPIQPMPGDAVPFTDEQCSQLDLAQLALTDGKLEQAIETLASMLC